LDAARRISEALFQPTDMDDLIHKALSTALTVVHADAGSLLLADFDTGELVFRYVIGDKADVLTGTRMPWDKGLAGSVFKSAQPEIIADVKQDERHFGEIDQATGYKSRDMIAMPLRRWGGEPIGVLEVLNKVNGHLDQDDVDILTIVSALSAAAIEQKRGLELLRQRDEDVRQSQKLEALGHLAGGIAHEFNNLLTVVIGYVELVLAGLTPDDPNRANLEQIKTAGGRASGLTQQLLAFSRKQVVQHRSLNLNGVVEESERILRWLLGERIELMLQLQPHLGYIKADQGQLKQVIFNLAIHARDTMPQGGTFAIETANIEVDRPTAREHKDVQPGPHVVLTVRDSGAEIDDETRAHMFEPFYTAKGLSESMGLGLAAVYGIVKQSNGFIEVGPGLEGGTTFRLCFPRIQQEEKDIFFQAAAPKFQTTASGSEEPATILIVDDEPKVRGLVRSILRMQGYTVLEAGRGEDALRLCRQHAGPIHLLLTDVVMPGLTGAPLSEQAKALRPDLKVLFMSGYTDDAISQEGVLRSGFSFIQKPFMPAALLQKIRDVLQSPD
jgi:two-component system cell cycle sensor histidine kinase/response regulator CckA